VLYLKPGVGDSHDGLSDLRVAWLAIRRQWVPGIPEPIGHGVIDCGSRSSKIGGEVRMAMKSVVGVCRAATSLELI
jgi:hypothetical protein